jgi:hypothetical protein
LIKDALILRSHPDNEAVLRLVYTTQSHFSDSKLQKHSDTLLEIRNTLIHYQHLNAPNSYKLSDQSKFPHVSVEVEGTQARLTTSQIISSKMTNDTDIEMMKYAKRQRRARAAIARADAITL